MENNEQNLETMPKETSSSPSDTTVDELTAAASGKKYADSPIEYLAVAAAKNANYQLEIDNAIQHDMIDGARIVVNIDDLLETLEHPLTQAGTPVELHTRENYKIYNCLKNMPHCMKSMAITRGDKNGKIGKNRPLENTICVAVHHLDDKSYGGLCVLREWGAVDMATVFVGYNPLQIKIWRSMIDDIPNENFTACILESERSSATAPSWAEGVYKIARDFNKFPDTSLFPTKKFDMIFNGLDTALNRSKKPLPFIDAQRSLCGYTFLQALAKGLKEHKQVFVWEDGGYLNPIIDEAIKDNLSVAAFRKKYMIPNDMKTDKILDKNLKTSLEHVFIGSVELTRNGYNATAALAEQRPLNTRFYSIAASYEKIMLEGDSITLACLDALSQVLYSTGNSLMNRTVLVMGARGNLGRLSVNHLINILKSSKEQLWGCDLKVSWPSLEPDTLPKWAEWAASDKPLANVAGECTAFRELPEKVRYGFDVILGWTGGPKTVNIDGKAVSYQTISGQDVADWLTKGKQKSCLYLVSGSTKTTEFSDVLLWLQKLLSTTKEPPKVNGIVLDKLLVEPIPDQLSNAAVAQMWPDNNPPATIARNFGTQFTFVFVQDNVSVTKTIYLVNNTMPVNFMYYGTPTEIMDMTYSQVTSCVTALINHKNDPPGIYPTDYHRYATDHVYLAKKLTKDYKIPSSI